MEASALSQSAHCSLGLQDEPAPDPLASVRNFRRLDALISTGGQPTEAQFQTIAVEGTRAVINLALPTSTYALSDERAVVTGLGMDYLAIPVVFEAPTAEDFARFCAELEARREQKVFIHCALNYRASAFMALYRMRRLGWSREAALTELLQVWEPDDVWSRFLKDPAGPMPG